MTNDDVLVALDSPILNVNLVSAFLRTPEHLSIGTGTVHRLCMKQSLCTLSLHTWLATE